MILLLSIIGFFISLWKGFSISKFRDKVIFFLFGGTFLCRVISLYDPNILYLYIYIFLLSLGLVLVIVESLIVRNKFLTFTLIIFLAFVLGSYSAFMEMPYKYEILVFRILLILGPFVYLLTHHVNVKKNLIFLNILILLLFTIEIIAKYQSNWFI